MLVGICGESSFFKLFAVPVGDGGVLNGGHHGVVVLGFALLA